MKFSQLSLTNRTILANIANVGKLNTESLARALGTSPAAAAHELCALRKAGLIFSHQKKAGEQYCVWEVTNIGQAIFDARPSGEALLDLGKASVESKLQAITRYVVVPEFAKDPSGTKEQAIMAAQHAAISTGRVHHVLGLVAEVTPPEQPQAVVTLL